MESENKTTERLYVGDVLFPAFIATLLIVTILAAIDGSYLLAISFGLIAIGLAALFIGYHLPYRHGSAAAERPEQENFSLRELFTVIAAAVFIATGLVAAIIGFAAQPSLQTSHSYYVSFAYVVYDRALPNNVNERSLDPARIQQAGDAYFVQNYALPIRANNVEKTLELAKNRAKSDIATTFNVPESYVAIGGVSFCELLP